VAPGRSTRVRRFADWATGLDFGSIPGRVVERARLQAMSTVAGALAGASAPGVRRLREATREWAAHGPAGVVGSRHSFEPAAAAYANAAASIAHDWDDYLYMGHTGHSAVWAARAVGDTTGADGDEVLAAQVAANEVEGRLGAALFVGPHNGQFWSSIHCAGAAVAAGRLRGLDAEQLSHAIAIALYQPPFGLWPGFMGPDTKLLTAAEPVAQGIRAAALAERGFSGPLDVIESPRGFLAHFSYAARPSMLDGLGDVWLTDTLAYKQHPGCAYLQAAIEGVLRLREENEFGAADVAQVQVRAGFLTTAMEKLAAGEPLTAVRVNFSVALSTAVALTAGRLTHEELGDDWLAGHDDELRDLATRVVVEHDWDLTLRTLNGASAGMPVTAALGDVSLRKLAGVRRRMQQSGMDEVGIGFGELRELARRLDAGAVRGLFRRGGDSADDDLAGLDTSLLRLTFPCHVSIRLRSGRMLETDGAEKGASGSPIAEQRAVVDAKWEATREAAELPSVWRRRPAPAPPAT
jgi:2-methylcitrate dehydratase PrpD